MGFARKQKEKKDAKHVHFSSSTGSPVRHRGEMTDGRNYREVWETAQRPPTSKSSKSRPRAKVPIKRPILSASKGVGKSKESTTSKSKPCAKAPIQRPILSASTGAGKSKTATTLSKSLKSKGTRKSGLARQIAEGRYSLHVHHSHGSPHEHHLHHSSHSSPAEPSRQASIVRHSRAFSGSQASQRDEYDLRSRCKECAELRKAWRRLE